MGQAGGVAAGSERRQLQRKNDSISPRQLQPRRGIDGVHLLSSNDSTVFFRAPASGLECHRSAASRREPRVPPLRSTSSASHANPAVAERKV